MSETAEKLKVKLYPFRKGASKGNIIWLKAHPMMSGRFPPSHPVGGGSGATMEYGHSPALASFRGRGYWASCFPEGDGIVWEPLNGQDFEQTLTDVRECFGWDVEATQQ